MQNTFDEVAVQFDGFEDERDFFDYDVSPYDGAELQSDNFLGFNKFAKKIGRKKRLSIGDIKHYRKMAMRNIENRAAAAGVPSEVIALQDVEKNRGVINKYIEMNGQAPQQNPAALALQASNIYQQKISDKQKKGVPDADVAEDAVMMDEQNSDWEEADEFLGGIVSGIFKAGKALINKINKKRKDKGKNELFKGETWQQIGKQIEAGQQPLTDKLNDLERKFLQKTNEELTKAQNKNSVGSAFVDGTMGAIKKEAIMKYLPWVLIGIVVIVIVARKFK